MTGTIDARIAELGLTLPAAAAPVATYVSYVQSGNLVHVSGQISRNADGLIVGRLGDTMGVEEGAAAAKSCALSLIAQVREACGGDLDRVARVVKLVGFVNAAPNFNDLPQVINGASDLMVAVFGDAGKHARSSVGVSALPMGVAVEIEAIFEVK